MERLALDPGQLRSAILEGSSLWRHFELAARTGSTNADLIAGAGAQAYPLGTVLVAEEQYAGRGRLDRAWQAPARSGLAVSVLIANPDRLEATLLPLLVGVAAIRALRNGDWLSQPEHAGLKWPNDIMVGERKVGGILTHQISIRGSRAIVAGLGLNVSLRSEELPTPNATSLLLEGATEQSRATYLISYLSELEDLLIAADTDSLLAEYTQLSATIGRNVNIEFPGGRKHQGFATDIDPSGSLVLSDGVIVSAGDVIHLR
ncbi:MAG TPA: biotin--[acetyl-CoA-carboxylase] ligase [Candidatus Nanopelagicaceae bacterium]|nr:biotin--[acetyl-CoA-carboxylase] ligase [Candidatus Nanopelagicaceae bacterium]